MNKSESITALASALCRAQGEMSAVPFDSTNPFLKNRFASLGAIIEHSRPILVKHGLSICQLPIIENVTAQDYEKHILAMQESAAAWHKKNPDKEDAQFSVPTILVGIESMLMHESGEWLSERILLPLIEEKGKSLAQVAGSVTTYLKRYSWASMLGIYAEEDADGNGHEKIPQRQVWRDEPTVLGRPGPSSPKPDPKPKTQETDEQKLARFLKLFENLKPYASEIFRREGFILETEDYTAISAGVVSQFKKSNVDALLADVKKLAGVSDNVPEPEGGSSLDDPKAPWRARPTPFKVGGIEAGTKFGDLPKEKLWWWCIKWQPKPYTSPKNGKTYPPKGLDLELREILDVLQQHYGFNETEQS